MQHNWYRTSWCHKIAALTIICSYFILLIFIHDTTYIWATLALVFVLFVTTFSCASNNTPFLLQLRGSRLTGITNRTIAEESNEEEQEQTETRIWMTDIPPSYSFVMADITPPTPPPSYGSAILMFPPPYVGVDSKTEQVLATETILAEGQQLRRPLSISTQVSVSSAAPETSHLGGITFSTQVSVISTQSEIPPDLALRARFYISRQASREDGTEDSVLKQEKMMGEASARLFLLSRQMSREDPSEEVENGIQNSGKVDRFAPPLVTRQISKEEGSEGMDLHKSMMKHDLRRRVLLSRQASREDRVSSKVIQEQDHYENSGRPLSRQSSVEDSAENVPKKSDGRVRIVILQQNSRDSTSKENQDIKESQQSATERVVEVEAICSTVSINIPEDLVEITKPSE
ncbi:uncharacterized protein [Halyomorpha halys]|uniref:uncharacterized protein n=1 Tax=Halyomorpha halys TaxID=286706 RepID=UPI0006D507E0|nr:uncharacterized protein LOC106680607 [Halyomorpha halys]